MTAEDMMEHVMPVSTIIITDREALAFLVAASLVFLAAVFLVLLAAEVRKDRQG